jgi:hypothetical protein
VRLEIDLLDPQSITGRLSSRSRASLVRERLLAFGRARRRPVQAGLELRAPAAKPRRIRQSRTSRQRRLEVGSGEGQCKPYGVGNRRPRYIPASEPLQLRLGMRSHPQYRSTGACHQDVAVDLDARPLERFASALPNAPSPRAIPCQSRICRPSHDPSPGGKGGQMRERCVVVKDKMPRIQCCWPRHDLAV